MFCRNCGKEINENADVCTNCGAFVNRESAPTKTYSQDYSTPKTGMGVLFALILGLIGLIIGICIYPEESVARKTFIKGWCITFAVSFGIGIVLGIIMYIVGIGSIIGFMNNMPTA